MKTTTKRIIQVAITLIFIAVGALGMIRLTASKPKMEKQRPAVSIPLVRAISVKSGPHTVFVRGEGTVRPLRQINLVPQVSGKVIYISPSLVNGGEFRKGRTLLRIDPVDYELAVTLAKAKIKNSESLLKLAEEQTAAAKEEWRLHRARGSKANIDPPPLVAKEPQLEAARAKLEADKADLQKALLHLERTEIKAPFNGRISQENVDIGQFVSPGQALASLYSTDAAEIILPMEDEDLFWFRVPGFTPNKGAGSSALVKARIAGRNQTWEGQVVRTEGILDERTRLIDVVVRVNKPYAKKPPLAVGFFVTVDIRGSTIPKAALIPRSALRSGNMVWILDEEEKLRFRQVDIAKFQDDHVIVNAGLEGTEKLIISPLKAVTDGMKVRGQLIEVEEKS